MSYPGGKNGAGVYQRIINLMPPHDVYIEPFLGGGAIMRHKQPARINIGIDRDPDAVRAFTVENDDAGFRFVEADGIGFLKSYPFTGGELVYCDPPYVRSTRTPRDLYRFEMDDDDHAALLDILTGLPCMAMISGYWSQLYANRLKDWNAVSFETMTRGGRMATEWLWFNFPPPVALHDYRYLGDDFRERERIKRKKDRWTGRLERMPLLERQALLAAIGEAWPQLAPSETTITAGIAGFDDAGPGPYRRK
jgi:DNA adenine methylase